MIHGYFRNGGHHPYPSHGYDSHSYRPYDPQGSMTAFAAGNTISTGSSYYGGGGGVGGGGGNTCRNCDSANKPVNGNGTKKNGNGPSNGNGRPTNGQGVHQHEVLGDIPVTDKPINANGQEPTPAWNQDVGYPSANGNGDYLGEQPAYEEVPKGDTLPSASPNIPADPEGGKKGKATFRSSYIPVFEFISEQGNNCMSLNDAVNW